jgi:hypothetical protein
MIKEITYTGYEVLGYTLEDIQKMNRIQQERLLVKLKKKEIKIPKPNTEEELHKDSKEEDIKSHADGEEDLYRKPHIEHNENSAQEEEDLNRASQEYEDKCNGSI